ncbi:MAG TPA: glycosyl hydrolase [Solirubrobacteraceae bacterium]|jgi:hypothetical protein|nr:glycosyl hydrolase [Solirubrobacteraceae bacterium]
MSTAQRVRVVPSPEHRRARRRRRRARRGALALVVALCVGGAAFLASSNDVGSGDGAPARPWECVSTSDLTVLASWEQLLHRPINCAVTFIDAAPTWQSWVDPWILQYRHNWPKYDWVDWMAGGHGHRHMVLTLSLIPADLKGSDWLAKGAEGAYAPYARALAERLIRAGMGDAVIRLGHEANGTWYVDSLPDTPAGDAEWARFWRITALTMKAVPGAHFRFDWTVNPGVRPIPLASFYPGNRAVDVIGVDAYDDLAGPAPAGSGRLQTVLDQPDGLRAVRAFARAHHKPMSVPEWGVGPPAATGAGGAAGDDPAYVQALAGVFHAGGVLYEAYFDGGVQGPQLLHSPRSLAVLRRDFGPGGVAAP